MASKQKMTGSSSRMGRTLESRQIEFYVQGITEMIDNLVARLEPGDIVNICIPHVLRVDVDSKSTKSGLLNVSCMLQAPKKD